MIITRLFTDAEGHSAFESLEMELEPAGDIGRLSADVAVEALVFRETDGDYDYDFHNAPRRQYIVLLDGIIEIETSRGEIRRFSTGDIILAEDTRGRGHRTKSVDGKLRRSLFIAL